MNQIDGYRCSNNTLIRITALICVDAIDYVVDSMITIADASANAKLHQRIISINSIFI